MVRCEESCIEEAVMRRKIVPWGVFGLLLPFGLLCAAFAQTHCPACSAFGIQQFQEKKAAPGFSLKTLDGTQTSLSDFHGRPVFFVFWASWCESCKDEIPLVDKFFRGKRGQVGVFLVAIDGEHEKRIRHIITEKKITLPVLLDVKEKIARTYGIRMVPTAILISQDGSEAGMIVGPRNWDAPEAWPAVKELLALP